VCGKSPAAARISVRRLIATFTLSRTDFFIEEADVLEGSGDPASTIWWVFLPFMRSPFR
jgi:hypothetical protein